MRPVFEKRHFDAAHQIFGRYHICRTREGCEEMAGNLAEWEADREREIRADERRKMADAVVEHLEIVARGTVDSMAKSSSETWKIIAHGSVEQYESLVRRVREIEAALDKEK